MEMSELISVRRPLHMLPIKKLLCLNLLTESPISNIKKKKLQRKLDRSRRATNPDNYKPDGTIKRGVKLTHNKSKRYLKLQSKLAYIQHRQAEIRKLQHTCLANHMLTLGDRFLLKK